MNLTRCTNGHFYDVDKFPGGCPHCNSNEGSEITVAANNLVSGGTAESVTVAMNSYAPPMDAYTVPMEPMGANMGMDMTVPEIVPEPAVATNNYNTATYNNSYDDDSKTISIFSHSTKTTGSEPVVGWLVCVSDSHFGQSFVLKSGRNFIGRGSDMDIVLGNDKAVSRDKHAIILFEPKKRDFLVQPGEARELFYLNDDVVLTTEKLKAYDVLSIGNTQLIFVPFCNEAIGWDDFVQAEK